MKKKLNLEIEEVENGFILTVDKYLEDEKILFTNLTEMITYITKLSKKRKK